MICLFAGAHPLMSTFVPFADAVSWSDRTGIGGGEGVSYPLMMYEVAYLTYARRSSPTEYAGGPSGTESGPDGEVVVETSFTGAQFNFDLGYCALSGVTCAED